MKKSKTKNPFGFPEKAVIRNRPTVGYPFLLMATKDENKQCLEAYRKKFQDLIDYSHIEARGLPTALRLLAQTENDPKYLEALLRLAENCLQQIFEITTAKPSQEQVRNQMDSVLWLQQNLSQSVHKLNLDAKRPERQSIYKLVASHSNCWPVLFYSRAKFNKAQQNFLIKDLALGKEYPVNKDTGDSPESLVARDILERIRDYRDKRCGYAGDFVDAVRALPVLTKSNAKQWWTVAGSKIFDDVFAPHVATGKIFSHWKKKQHKDKDGKYPYVPEKPGVLRNDIKREVRKAFLRLPAKR